MNEHNVPICPSCQRSDSVFLRTYRSTHPLFANRNLFRCPVCELIFADLMPSSEELDSYYASDYRGSGKLFAPQTTFNAWDSAHARARSQIAFVKPYLGDVTSWLDVGAGYGLLLDELRGLKKIAAVEPEPNGANRIKEQGYTLYADIESSGSGWNVISFSHVLEHICNPLTFLASVSAHLADHGLVFCEVPKVSANDETDDDTPHVLFFNQMALQKLFEQSGFEVVRSSLCGAPENGIIPFARRVARRTFARPVPLFDPLLFRHFKYSEKGVWLRLIARRT